MSFGSALSTTELCEEKSQSILLTGDSLLRLDDSWFAVCYFYAAYHLMRASFIADPIFESLPALSRVSPNLTFEHRWVTHHSGRVSRGERTLGINDVVRMLYPQVSAIYLRLHSASVGVRYYSGLAPITKESVQSDFQVIADAYSGGELVHQR